MKNFKIMMIMGFMLLIVMVSKPVMAMELKSFTDVPNFSIVIGENMYTLDYANDSSNESKISAAIVANTGDVYIKTDDSGWTKNSDATKVSNDSVDVSTIKFYNGSAIVVPVVPVVPVASKVSKIEVNPNITITSTNTATFTFELFDKDGIDITNTIPASELNAYATVYSTISLDPTTGIGTITFNSSYNTSTPIIITIMDKNGTNGDSQVSKVSQILIYPVVTKTGDYTTTFTYKLIDQNGLDITKTTPASQISAIASVVSTIVLDPSTATGTITYKTSTDVDTAIKITLMDTITGTNAIAVMAIPTHIIEVPRIDKITIASTELSTVSGKYGYAVYNVYDQDGNDITNLPIASNVIFKSTIGTVVSKNGVITITANDGIDFGTFYAVILTGSDAASGITMNTTLIINNH